MPDFKKALLVCCLSGSPGMAHASAPPPRMLLGRAHKPLLVAGYLRSHLGSTAAVPQPEVVELIDQFTSLVWDGAHVTIWLDSYPWLRHNLKKMLYADADRRFLLMREKFTAFMEVPAQLQHIDALWLRSFAPFPGWAEYYFLLDFVTAIFIEVVRSLPAESLPPASAGVAAGRSQPPAAASQRADSTKRIVDLATGVVRQQTTEPSFEGPLAAPERAEAVAAQPLTSFRKSMAIWEVLLIEADSLKDREQSARLRLEVQHDLVRYLSREQGLASGRGLPYCIKPF